MQVLTIRNSLFTLISDEVDIKATSITNINKGYYIIKWSFQCKLINHGLNHVIMNLNEVMW